MRRTLPPWAVVAIAGAGGVVGSFTFVAPWLLVPAVVAAVVVAWWASPAMAAFGAGVIGFCVAVGNAESPDGSARWLLAAGAFALVAATVVLGARSIFGAGDRRARVVAPGIAALGVVVAAVLPGPAVPVTEGAVGEQLDPETVERIDDYVLDAMRARRAPGLALAIVRGQDLVLARGYGVASADREPVTPGSTFIMASLTKSFTSLATMQLVEEGLVELDAPVQDYLPWFRVGGDDNEPITVRQLLNQTSGFSRRQGQGTVMSDDPRSLESAVRDLADVEPVGAPGDEYRYSNLNAMILGMIVQEVSGEPYADYVDAHVFAPLGMTSTLARPGTGSELGLAEGHRVWFGVPVVHGTTMVESSVPFAGISSSVADMSRYLRMYLGDGTFDGETVLSPDGIATMLERAPDDPEEFADDDPPRWAYAMGWNWSEDEDGDVRLAHSGTAPEYSAGMTLVPAEGLGVIVLANELDTLVRVGGVADGVTDILVGDDPPPAGGDAVRWYLIGTLLVVAILAGLVHAVGALRGWRAGLTKRRTWRVVLWALLLNVLVPLALLTLPARIGGTWPMAWTYAPDFTLVLVGTALILAGLGVAKIVLAVRRVTAGPSVNGGLHSATVGMVTTGDSVTTRRATPR